MRVHICVLVMVMEDKSKCKARVSRVTKVPAKAMLWEGDRGLAADSQGHTVDVGARLGTETSVEIICHAVCMGDTVEKTKKLIGRVKLDSGMIRTQMSYQKTSKILLH